MGWYRAAVDVGAYSWDVEAGDPMTTGPVLPLTFGWQLPDSLPAGYPAQPDPHTASLRIVVDDAAELAGVDVGTDVRIRVYLDQLSGTMFAYFTGRVAELAASPFNADETGGQLLYTLECVDYLVDLSAELAGLSDYSAESVGNRVDSILSDVGWADSGAAWVGGTVGAREADPAAALAMLTELLRDVAGPGTDGFIKRNIASVRIDDATGYPDLPWTLENRQAALDVLSIDVLDASAVALPGEWVRTRRQAATSVAITHPDGLGDDVATVYGDTGAGPAHPTLSSQLLDPEAVADVVLSDAGDPAGVRWQSDTMRLYLDFTDQDRASWGGADPSVDTTAAGRWLPSLPPVGSGFADQKAGIGRHVVVENMPAHISPDGSGRVEGRLSSARLTVPESGSPFVDFTLYPHRHAATFATLGSYQPGLTLGTIDPAITLADAQSMYQL